jgi:nitrogen fixation/metabolism regulation signal transduction histidine kinase
MKPLLSESEDNHSLQALGRASVQIVHDLKNQLNGLKLYATFLRKRLEKGERPADELETMEKLIAGIDRTAADLSLLSDFGRPLELKKQGATDIEQILRGVVANVNSDASAPAQKGQAIIIETEASPLFAEVDAALLAESLKSISTGAVKLFKARKKEGPLRVQVTSEAAKERRDGVIDWHVLDSVDHDPFHSFAGTDEIRLSLAAKVIEAHGGSAERCNGALRVRLPLVGNQS